MRIFLLAAIFSFLAGCTAVPPAVIENPVHEKPIASRTDKSKSIFIANISSKLIDTNIGQVKLGTLCINQAELLWKANPSVLNAIKEAIANSLSKNGYNVYSGLIQAEGEKDADILIGVGIEDVKANLCSSIEGQKGDVSMRLKFEVLDNKTRNSFTKVVSGSGSIAEFSKTGDPDIFIKAAEMATDNFLADEAFFKATRK